MERDLCKSMGPVTGGGAVNGIHTHALDSTCSWSEMPQSRSEMPSRRRLWPSNKVKHEMSVFFCL
jgi:hypothetical protein